MGGQPPASRTRDFFPDSCPSSSSEQNPPQPSLTLQLHTHSPLRSLINNSTRLEPKESSEGRNALAESLQSASYMLVLVVVVVVAVMKAATVYLCCKKSL